MPAAIRIDVKLTAVQGTFETPGTGKDDVRKLAAELSERVRAGLIEHYKIKSDEMDVLSGGEVDEKIEGQAQLRDGSFSVHIRCDLGN